MKETAVQVNQRQIRNGIRKQAEAIQREKDKVWDKISTVNKENNPNSIFLYGATRNTSRRIYYISPE